MNLYLYSTSTQPISMQTENACQPLYAKNTPHFLPKYIPIIHIFQQIINDVIYFRWIKSSDIKKCELCKFTFVMQSKVKRHLQTSQKWLTVAIWLSWTVMDDCYTGSFLLKDK